MIVIFGFISEIAGLVTVFIAISPWKGTERQDGRGVSGTPESWNSTRVRIRTAVLGVANQRFPSPASVLADETRFADGTNKRRNHDGQRGRSEGRLLGSGNSRLNLRD